MRVVATAGHVDHGKSTLVRALTGTDPDRWVEEKRRGLTIDLGYAWTTLDDGTELAFVDVPGHEKFVANMLAGVGPVRAVMLVIAADAGWCQQTAEHVAALDALGITHGVVAVTRSDLADPRAASEQARDKLADTSLAGSDIVPVSPVTGRGLAALRRALARMAAGLGDAPGSRATRLWVDRVFSIVGAGTVVTGTLASGTIHVGDELVTAPGGQTVRVRALQSLATPRTEVTAMARVAVNARSAKVGTLRRGDTLVSAGLWTVTAVLDVRLTGVEFRLPGQTVLHIGTAAIAVRIRPLGADIVRLHLHSAVAAHVGDRGLLRNPGTRTIIAGVDVLDVDPPPLLRRGAAARRAADLSTTSGAGNAAGEVRRRGAVRRDALVAAGFEEMGDDTPAEAIGVGAWLVHREQWSRWCTDLAALVDTWARGHPLSPGLPPATACQRLALPDAALLSAILEQSRDVRLNAQGIQRHGAGVRFPEPVAVALSEIADRLASHPFDAPDAGELQAAGLSDEHLRAAVAAGRLIRCGAGVYLLPTAIGEAQRRLAGLAEEFTVSEARTALGTTRRVAVPLLELLDRMRITQRVDTRTHMLTAHGRRTIPPAP